MSKHKRGFIEMTGDFLSCVASSGNDGTMELAKKSRLNASFINKIEPLGLFMCKRGRLGKGNKTLYLLTQRGREFLLHYNKLKLALLRGRLNLE